MADIDPQARIKAKTILQAKDDLIAEYVQEGKGQLALKVRDAFVDVPEESLARLYDIMFSIKP